MKKNNKNSIVAAAGVMFVAIFAIAATIYSDQKITDLNNSFLEKAEYFERDHPPGKVPRHAAVTIVEFFAPGCVDLLRVSIRL